MKYILFIMLLFFSIKPLFAETIREMDKRSLDYLRDQGKNGAIVYDGAFINKKFCIEVEKKIKTKIPLSIRPTDKISGMVRIIFEKNGKVKNAMIRESTSNEKLDNALIEAIYEASPFDDVPWALRREATSRGVLITISFNDKEKEKANDAYLSMRR